MIQGGDMQDIELYFDEDGKLTGYSGKVDVLDKEIFIDTKTGIGYDRVLSAIEHMIRHLSDKFNIDNFSYEDNKQQIALYALEIIAKYDPRKGTKLSTFLQIALRNELINKIRDQNTAKRNPTFLNVKYKKVTCTDCKHVFVFKKKIGGIAECPKCQKIMRVTQSNSININFKEKHNVFMDSLSDLSYISEDEIIENQDIIKLINSIDKKDPVLAKLVKLIVIDDLSLTKAAEVAGVTPIWARIKIKRLKKNKIIREIFDDQKALGCP